ncbi:MAG: serpin family protein [Thermoplasmatota archaeon]
MFGDKRVWIAVGAVLAVVIIAFASTWTCNHFFGEDDLYALGISDKVLMDKDATDSGIKEMVHAHNQFAIDLYLELANGSEKNIFFSPFSLFTALMMTYEGARGNTADEMAEVMHLPINDDQRRAAFASVQNDLNGREGRVKLNIANSLWMQKDYQFKQEFLEVLEDYYFSEAFVTDLGGDQEGSREAINQWVSKNTEKRIPELLPLGSFDQWTKAVLVNALYFKGDWATEFDVDRTGEEPFYIDRFNYVQAEMMHTDPDAEDTAFRVNWDQRSTVLELPYKGDKISMVAFLPEIPEMVVNANIHNLENILDAKTMADMIEGLEEQDIQVSMPKFQFESEYMVSQPLQRLGMRDAFVYPTADFTGISDQSSLFIDEVYQDTFINVDETGTEAAAATAVVMKDERVATSVDLNRPYIFTIQDRETGLILFMGRIMDPSKM